MHVNILLPKCRNFWEKKRENVYWAYNSSWQEIIPDLLEKSRRWGEPIKITEDIQNCKIYALQKDWIKERISEDDNRIERGNKGPGKYSKVHATAKIVSILW